MQGRTHADIDWNGRRVVFRDLEGPDLQRVADYWLLGDQDHFRSMGVDVDGLGDRKALVQRFAQALPTGEPDQMKHGFAFDVDGVMVGYTYLNRYTPTENYSHWHIVDPQWRNSGLSSLLYPYRLKTYFALTPIERLIHQTRVENVGVNRLLDRFVPIAETRFIENPDGASLPGTFHLRFVTRADLPRMFGAG